MEKQADIGLIGLGVMGENLVLNMVRNGFVVGVFNRTIEKVDAFVNGRGKGKQILPAHTIDQFVHALKKPRKVMLMVKAGPAVDDMIEQLVLHLGPGDMIIDGGNSHYTDTNQRVSYLKGKGLLYVGSGVSGGEEGALNGPSLMPGGTKEAWPHIEPIFQKIAAKSPDGRPCCDWMGKEGAGHFVKMVHNGIEYGDMQLIAEAYHIMKDLLGMDAPQMHETFSKWNQGDLNSYLIEITAAILNYRDENDDYLLEKVLDTAGQKGTGKWTVEAAMDLGSPLTLINASVFARFLSTLKSERTEASKILTFTSSPFGGDKNIFLQHLEQALFASKMVSYAQGFSLLRSAATEYQWDMDFKAIALIWRGGCIIRSAFLDSIADAYTDQPDLANLMLAPFFKQKLMAAQSAWRNIVSQAILSGLPVPAMASALSYFDTYRTARLPSNLVQAQRDYFGAHTYERIDRPRGEFFHTNWTGTGG